MESKAISVYRTLRTIWLDLFARSDYQRWSKEESFNKSWDTRTELIASLIPEGTTVLEFGAGRMSLKHYLSPLCRYTPSDIIDRGNGTIVCDLNDPHLPKFAYFDVLVFGGVLEYIYDLDRLISHLKDSCGTIIVSYAVSDFLGQKTILQRRQQGWVNEFSKDEFLNLFSKYDLLCEQIFQWQSQYVFKFNKKRIN